MTKKDEIPWPLSEFAKAGQDIGDAFVGMISAFIGKFASVVNRAVGYSGVKKITETVGGKRYAIDFVKYDKKNAIEVGARLLLLVSRKPLEVGRALVDEFNPFGKNLDSLDHNVSGFDDAALAGVGATLIALLPVLLPKMIEMLGSIVEGETAKTNQEMEAAKAAAEAARKEREEKAKREQTLLYIGGGFALIAVIGVGVVMLRRN